jgi:hypothetical protein
MGKHLVCAKKNIARKKKIQIEMGPAYCMKVLGEVAMTIETLDVRGLEASNCILKIPEKAESI